MDRPHNVVLYSRAHPVLALLIPGEVPGGHLEQGPLCGRQASLPWTLWQTSQVKHRCHFGTLLLTVHREQ